MSKAEKENRIHSFALEFLERQQIVPNLYADQIIRGYKEGYRQAEKDLELTWEDLATIEKLGDDFVKHNQMPMNDEEFFKEILKRFKDLKHVK